MRIKDIKQSLEDVMMDMVKFSEILESDGRRMTMLERKLQAILDHLGQEYVEIIESDVTIRKCGRRCRTLRPKKKNKN